MSFHSSGFPLLICDQLTWPFSHGLMDPRKGWFLHCQVNWIFPATVGKRALWLNERYHSKQLFWHQILSLLEFLFKWALYAWNVWSMFLDRRKSNLAESAIKLNRLHTHSCLEVAHRSILPQTDFDLPFQHEHRPVQGKASKTGSLSTLGMASTHALQTQEYAKPANNTPHENRNEFWRHQSMLGRVFEPLLARAWNPCSRNDNLPIDVYIASSGDKCKCGDPRNISTKFLWNGHQSMLARWRSSCCTHSGATTKCSELSQHFKDGARYSTQK